LIVLGYQGRTVYVMFMDFLYLLQFSRQTQWKGGKKLPNFELPKLIIKWFSQTCMQHRQCKLFCLCVDFKVCNKDNCLLPWHNIGCCQK